MINVKEPTPVVYFDLDGNYLGEFPNAAKACRTLNITAKHIWENLSRRTLKCGNYIFLEKEKYKEGMIITYASLKRKKDFLNKFKK